MTAEIEQCALFTSFGNAYAAGLPLDGERLQRSLRFVASMTFVMTPQLTGSAPYVVAHDPVAWFDALARSGTRRFSLVHVPRAGSPRERPALAAFVRGGGEWMIAAHEEKLTVSWLSRWSLAAEPVERPRIWSVEYAGCAAAPSIRPLEPELGAVRDALDRALRDALALANGKPDLRVWAGYFERARAALISAAPESLLDERSAPVLAEGMHVLMARQLVTAAQCAWVFGGMGSWNDYTASDDAGRERYQAVTAALYAAVVDAIPAGVNTLATTIA